SESVRNRCAGLRTKASKAIGSISDRGSPSAPLIFSAYSPLPRAAAASVATYAPQPQDESEQHYKTGLLSLRLSRVRPAANGARKMGARVRRSLGERRGSATAFPFQVL